MALNCTALFVKPYMVAAVLRIVAKVFRISSEQPVSEGLDV
jgi:hypothetical protein